MIPVGLARTASGYGGVVVPYPPGEPYPELEPLFGSGAAAAGAARPNPAYAAVRGALAGLGLDLPRFGRREWNPLGALVGPGRHVVLKPNFIRHWNPNPEGTLDSVVTHGSVLRAIADYAFKAVGREGRVTIAEAPQQDCDFDAIRAAIGLDALVRFYEGVLARELHVIDLRREAVRFEGGVIVARRSLPGDPEGYRVIDLQHRSAFHASGLDPKRFRGADYDPAVTSNHHEGGRHQYLLSETVLKCDLIVNLPKLKTHKKTGVTLALKNLVGINGDKNWLPHHSLGADGEGGDEYPTASLLDRIRSQTTELARPFLQQGRLLRFFRVARRLESAVRGEEFVRSGNWWGNRTTWRMCVDLNRCLYYSDPSGEHLDAPAPVRTVLTVLDGIVAGEETGPLAPRDRPLGVVLAATDPIALDLVAVRLMGFDEARIPKVLEPMRAGEMRVTAVSKPEDVKIVEVETPSFARQELALDELRCDAAFRPHPGWRGHIERELR